MSALTKCGAIFPRHADGELVACVLARGHASAHAFAENLADVAHRLAAAIAVLLSRSPFKGAAMWPHAVVVLTPDERRVTSRGDFAGWLAANDLCGAAEECARRRVPPGSVLVWLLLDSHGAATAAFHTFDLARAVRATLNAGEPEK